MSANTVTAITTGRVLTNDGSSVDSLTWAGNIARVEILNLSTTARIYARVDGTNPASPWNDCYVIPPGGVRVIETTNSAASDVVKLTASASCEYAAVGI
jgi:hypothetical protein